MIRDAMSCNLTIIDVLVPFILAAVAFCAAFTLICLFIVGLILVDVVAVVDDDVAIVLFPFIKFESDDKIGGLRFNAFPFSLLLLFVMKSSKNDKDIL